MNIFATAICLALTAYCSASYSCPGIWETSLNRSCYKVLAGNFTWDDASVACRQIGGHLAIVTSQEETDYLMKYTNRRRDRFPLWCYWLDGKDDESETHWYWDWTGEQIKGYSYWNPGEPSNSYYQGEDCLAMHDNGRWNDMECPKAKCQAICEKEMGQSEYANEIRCEGHHGGHLTIINNADEQNYLTNILKSHSEFRRTHFWIGGTDREKQGQWMWEWTGQNVTAMYTNWHTRGGEPNNLGGHEHCMEFGPVYEYQWNDIPCNNHFNALCEKD